MSNHFFSGDTDDFRQFVSVNTSFTMDSVLPTLYAIERETLPRFLGSETTELLLESAQDLPALANQPILLRGVELARVVVAKLGMGQYLPFAEVMIGDEGVTVPGGGTRKAAFEYQTKKLERQLTDGGWSALDDLIRHVATHPDEFPDWSESSYAQEHQQALFKSAAEFSRYYPIGDRWLTFWALRPFMATIEADRGADAIQRLDEKLGDRSDPAYLKIYKNLLRALAYESVLMALPHLSIELNGANVQVNYASQYANINYYTPPGREHLDWVTQNLQRQLDIAWGVFETGLQKLDPPATGPNDTGAGFIGGESFVMI